eukprot:m.171858 g.171858  ORF g.171858 m.171858 type:complete len:702 (-) comp21272_c0_seq4:21-2126(-)
MRRRLSVPVLAAGFGLCAVLMLLMYILFPPSTHVSVLSPLTRRRAGPVPDMFVPIEVVNVESADPTVHLCRVDQRIRTDNPAQYPMFRHLSQAFCTKESNLLTLPVSTLEKMPETAALHGLIFHQSRCGSTLAANMLAADAENLVYSESHAPVAAVLRCPACSDDHRIRVLRAVVHAMGNSLAHQRMFLKLQSKNSPHIALFRKAFPHTPWIFIMRKPAQIFASHKRGGSCLQSLPVGYSARVNELLNGQFTPARACAAHLFELLEQPLKLASEGDKQGMLVDYHNLAPTLLLVFVRHFGYAVSTLARERMQKVAGVYSKTRSDTTKEFHDDSQAKEDSLTPEEKTALSTFVDTAYTNAVQLATAQLEALKKSGNFQDALNPFAHKVSKGDEHVQDYLPYPELKPLRQFLDQWPPDDPDMPSVPGIAEGTLQRFDFSDEKQREQAALLRLHEVPFMLYNIPTINTVVDRWTHEYLAQKFGPSRRRVHMSSSNHFMYYNAHKARQFSGYRRPTKVVQMSYSEWLKKAKETLGASNVDSEHYYFQMDDRVDKWIAEDLNIFKPKEGFFIVEPSQNRGINCRFGSRGIIAECHYDGGRNFVAMLKGAKRYILMPPEECDLLYLYNRDHPEARHSAVDLSQVDWTTYPRLNRVRAAQVVVREGEVLYIPSYWFHYIISTGISAQCNSRSGLAARGRDYVAACGFY